MEWDYRADKISDFRPTLYRCWRSASYFGKGKYLFNTNLDTSQRIVNWLFTKRVQTEGKDPPCKKVSQAISNILSRQGVPGGTKVKLQKTKFSLDL